MRTLLVARLDGFQFKSMQANGVDGTDIPVYLERFSYLRDVRMRA